MADDGLHGYATDFYPNLFKTANGGISWTKITNIPGSVTGLHFFNSDTGLVTTAGGKIYKTQNGGASWALKYNPATAVGLSDVEFIDDNLGFSVGDKGTVLESSDGGDTWTLTILNALASFRRIEFHGHKAFVLGSSGKVWLYEISTESLNHYHKNTAITCYPNPVSNSLTLSVKNREIRNITIYNALGQQVLAPQLQEAEDGIDVSSLKPALYLICVTEANGRKQMTRMIKE